VTVGDLLRASLVGSDNSATAALVRLSGLSEGDFVGRMNEMAADIGMRATTFYDPTGLSADNRSVASDIARLIDEALKVDVVREATQLPYASFQGASGRAYAVETTDDLLNSFLNAPPYKIVGGKTGYLPEAGYCLGSLVSENGGHEIIVVVLGSETITGRFQDVKALAAWAYKAFEWPDERRADSL
jgi:D-alanyl-D-alanine carboxypeptidase